MQKVIAWSKPLFVALVMLSGCATYHAQPIDPAALMNTFETRTLDDPDLHRYVTSHLDGEASSRPPKRWDLTTLTLAAFYFSPDLDVARAKQDARQAAIQTAGQRPNPSLQFPFAYTTNPKNGESPYTFGLGLDIPIEIAGKRGYRLAQARRLSNAARFNIGNVAWQVRSRLPSLEDMDYAWSVGAAHCTGLGATLDDSRTPPCQTALTA